MSTANPEKKNIKSQIRLSQEDDSNINDLNIKASYPNRSEITFSYISMIKNSFLVSINFLVPGIGLSYYLSTYSKSFIEENKIKDFKKLYLNWFRVKEGIIFGLIYGNIIGSIYYITQYWYYRNNMNKSRNIKRIKKILNE